MNESPNAMAWSRLIVEAGLTDAWGGRVNPEIRRVVEDSRRVGPGCCFVAVRGHRVDGHAYIHQAVAAGAAAIVCERAVEVPAHVALLRVPDSTGTASRLAAVLTGLADMQRQGRFTLVGITGTNGKSTFCYLLRAILRRAGLRTALLGTVQYDLLGRTVTAEMTTPPATTLIEYLAEAARAGATHAVMEVSSHALDQRRCDGLRFAVGVFSNLTGDHLDYHHTRHAYLKAKKRLFDGLDARATAVINTEDPAGPEMVADCAAPVMRYGIEGDTVSSGDGAEAPDVTAKILAMTTAGTRFELRVRPPDGAEAVEVVDLSLVGRHNVQNALAAAAAAVALGVDVGVIAAGLQEVSCVPGRLQRVASGADALNVLVDYAHTDDALKNVLSALRPLTRGRLIVVFGCGGDRDRTKRPRMAAVAARLADVIIVTSDNPRTEDPQAIIDDILAGFPAEARARVTVEPDRRQAIHRAIAAAEPTDVVLLAGKGHETYQQIGDRKIDFDDVAVAREALAARVAC